MYSLLLHINKRNDMIHLVQVTGHYFKENAKDHPGNTPWTILLGADSDSGKSLLALAIDSVFRPHLYPDGISHEVSADSRLKPDFFGSPVPPVIFSNFQNLIYSSQEYFDSALEDFIHKYSGAKVYVSANIQRTFTGEFNYAAHGLCSNWLDANFHVYGHKKDGFKRRIVATVKDRAFFQTLQTAGMDF